MKKYWILLLIFAFLAAVLGFFIDAQEKSQTSEVHYHAGFVVFIEGQKQDYSDFQYMSLSPCSTETSELTKEEQQIHKAHLHDQVGDVAHVHTAGSTWGDLFKNMGINLDNQTELVAYANGNKVNEVLDKQIEADESLIFLSGNLVLTPEIATQSVQLEHLREVESTSEFCGS